VFLINKDLFKSKVMYFELCNLPGTFQQMMNSIFKKLLHEEVLENYIDDFVIPAKAKKKLKERIVQFLKMAKKHNLYFKLLKYNFNAKKISILGVVVG